MNNKHEAKPLTDRGIASMKPGEDKADTDSHAGLRVTCGKTGKKSFFYRYRSPATNKLVQVKLGEYPHMSLLDARNRHRELKNLRSTGVCPKAYIAKKQAELLMENERNLRGSEQALYSMKDLVEDYLTGKIETRNVNKNIKVGRSEKGQTECRRTLEVDVVKTLGECAVVNVKSDDIEQIIRNIIEDRQSPVQAGNVMRELSSAYEYAIDRVLDEDFKNPVVKVKKKLKAEYGKQLTAQKRKNYLSLNQVKVLLNWLPFSAFSTTQKNVLRLALYTGCRTGEVCDAEWKDIDLDNKVWHIPDPKNNTPRDVQLSKQAVHLLTQLKEVNAYYPFQTSIGKNPLRQKSLSEVMWAMRNPEKVSYNRKITKEQRLPAELAGWSPHDLRRTVRTHIAKLGCPLEVAEAILGHSKEGIVENYNLHSYDKECSQWLQMWCDKIDGLKNK